jgi:non-specific serine/threonine protein kinase
MFEKAGQHAQKVRGIEDTLRPLVPGVGSLRGKEFWDHLWAYLRRDPSLQMQKSEFDDLKPAAVFALLRSANPATLGDAETGPPGVLVAPPKQETPAANADSVFRKDGEIWTISFEGKTVRVRHLVGMGYIADLLRHPRTEIEAATLGASIRGDLKPPGEVENETIVEVSASMSGMPMADAEAIRQVKAALVTRQDELADTSEDDGPARTQLQDEISKLEHYLSSAEGHRGQIRKTGGVSQRSRSRVKHAIDRAIDKIKVQHPSLGKHLKDSIRTGTSIVYMPTDVPDWSF